MRKDALQASSSVTFKGTGLGNDPNLALDGGKRITIIYEK